MVFPHALGTPEEVRQFGDHEVQITVMANTLPLFDGVPKIKFLDVNRFGCRQIDDHPVL